MLALVFLFAAQPDTFAHDIPNDVTVQIFLKPDAQRLNLLVRVPLRAVRDIVFPERGQGYLDLERAQPMLRDAATLWLGDSLFLFEDGRPLPKPAVQEIRLSLESDKSFTGYDTAVEHLRQQLPAETNIVWNQTLLDVHFEVPIASAQSHFAIHPALARLGLRVVTVLRTILPDGTVRAFEYPGDPGLVQLDPSWWQAAGHFISLGFRHILDGTDHLLFLICLVIPVRRLRSLIPVVTAFTLAHSVTLIASAYDFAPDAFWFPPLIETLIAASIVFMALENIVSAYQGTSNTNRRWMVAFGFGLIHGFGFSFALRQTLQFAGAHLLTSLLSFNIGVELGQVLVLLISVPLLELLFRRVLTERLGIIMISALVAHTGWHWMMDRGAQLSAYRFTWPVWDAATGARMIRGLMLVFAAAGVAWIFRALWQKWTQSTAALVEVEK